MKTTKKTADNSELLMLYRIPKKLLQEFQHLIEKANPKKQRGRPRASEETILSGISYALQTGCPWQALPACFGPAKTVYHWFSWLRKTDASGTLWKKLLNKSDNKKAREFNHQAVVKPLKKSPQNSKKQGARSVNKSKRGR